MATPIFTENQLSEYRDRILAGGQHAIKPPPSFVPPHHDYEQWCGFGEVPDHRAESRRAAAEAEVAAIRKMREESDRRRTAAEIQFMQQHWTGVRADDVSINAELDAILQQAAIAAARSSTTVPIAVSTPTPAPVTATPKPIPVPGKRKMVL